ncbi:MAG: hypothetical protein IJF31_06275 [Clostridia bacterium]|nr:hypothetical protein [Clostridia bacterium]
MQKIEKPRFWRASLFYFFTTLLPKLAVFLLLPLYTAKIPAGDMGVFDTATALAVFLAVTLFFDVGIGVMQGYLGAKSEEGAREVLAAGLVFVVLSLLAYVPLGLLLVWRLRVPHGGAVVRYGAAHSLFTAACYFARAKGRRLCYALGTLFTTLLQVGLTVYFLLVTAMGYEALYLSFVVATLLGALFLFWRSGAFSALGAARTCRKALVALWRFCLPLGASAAAFLALSSGARVLTTLCLGAEAGGIVAVAVKLAQVAFVVATVLRFAWQEVCFLRGFDESGAGDRAYYTARVSLLLRAVVLGALLLIPLLRVWLWLFPSFIAPDYGQAQDLLPIVLIGALFSVVTDFLEPPLAMLKKTGTVLVTCASGAAVGILTTLLLFAAGLGTWGAAIGFTVGFFVCGVLRLVCLARLMHAPLDVRALCSLPLLFLPVAIYLWLPPVASLLLALAVLPLGVLTVVLERQTILHF